jgi:[ribosomal protein S18]-alanine N-acetyltransferase
MIPDEDQDPHGLQIRACRVEDLKWVIEIERESFPDPYDEFTFLQILDAEPEAFLVVEAHRELLGYIAAAVRGRRATILSLAVSADHRRKGVGRMLMGAELRYLSTRADVAHLQVGVSNSAARALYTSYSFLEMGKIARYYPNGEDAILMKLQLKS